MPSTRINPREYGSNARYELEVAPVYFQCGECTYVGTAFSFYLDGRNHYICPCCKNSQIKPI